MDRRTAIATISCGIVLTPGCLNSMDENGTWDPEVSGGDVELEAGEDTVLQIEADGIRGMQIAPEGNTGYGRVKNGSEVTINPTRTINPRPDRYIDVEPQIYGWDSTESVTIDIRVETTDNANDSEYPYSVKVFKGSGESPGAGQSEAFEFAIQVRE